MSVSVQVRVIVCVVRVVRSSERTGKRGVEYREERERSKEILLRLCLLLRLKLLML